MRSNATEQMPLEKACAAEVRAYKVCLKRSACVVGGGSLKDCAKTTSECERTRAAWSLCKRNRLNMRTRIRGPKGQRGGH